MRARIKKAFDEVGIEIPFPQRTVWIRNENDADDSAEPLPADSVDRRERAVRNSDDAPATELADGGSGHDFGDGGDE